LRIGRPLVSVPTGAGCCTDYERAPWFRQLGGKLFGETLTMPQYLLSVWHDEPYDDLDFSSADMQRRVAQVAELNGELARAGAWVFGVGLRPASSASVVRSVGGAVSMTDGPYAESKEQMGGFWIIEAADLEGALDWAAKAAVACEGPVEVRPTEDA
jgi:hypothetical protein